MHAELIALIPLLIDVSTRGDSVTPNFWRKCFACPHHFHLLNALNNKLHLTFQHKLFNETMLWNTLEMCERPKVKRKGFFSLNEMKCVNTLSERFNYWLNEKTDRRDLSKSVTWLELRKYLGDKSGGFPFKTLHSLIKVS